MRPNPPAVAAASTPQSAIPRAPGPSSPTEIADAASDLGNPSSADTLPHNHWFAEHVAQHRGYQLVESREHPGDQLPYSIWWAWDGAQMRLIDVSCYNFTPTQARFNWLVEAGFPNARALGLSRGGPLTNTMIDRAIKGWVLPGPDVRVLEAGHRAFARLQGVRI